MNRFKYRRKIKLFISSTFMDMNVDRDYLNHFVFPVIKDYCRERYIDFIPVDLRWGITEEDSKHGLVVNSCLSEINDCRPFFIGILGGRYGWCPNRDEIQIIDTNLLKDEDWVMSCINEGLSITEIEIRYAVLRNMNITHAAFFLRNDDSNHPVEYYEVSGSEAEAKLCALKNKIKTQDKYKYYHYSSPSELGELITREIIHFIDSEFPEENQDKEQAILAPHLEALRHRPTYLDLSEYFAIIDSFWNHDNKLNVIWGFPGVGASTMLVNYVNYINGSDRGWKVIYFDFSAVPYGMDLLEAYDEFMSLNENQYTVDEDVLICIDNANILRPDEASIFCSIFSLLNFSKVNARYLLTLSHESPLKQELILSGLSFRMLSFKGFRQKEINQYVSLYAQEYGKKFSEDQLKLISSCQGLDNPTDLRILLDSLVNYGYFDTLDSYIKELVDSCTTIANSNYKGNVLADGLFKKMLEVYLQIFEEQGLSRTLLDVLLCISVAGGVSENVLIEAFELSLEQWSILRPAVMHFCNGSGERLYLIKNKWEFEIIKFQSANNALLALLKFEKYLFDNSEDGHSILKVLGVMCQFINRCTDEAQLDSLAGEIVDLKNEIVERFFLSAELNRLYGEDIHNLLVFYTYHTTKELFLEFIQTKIPIDVDEACQYIVKIASCCESLDLLDYASGCYRLLSEHSAYREHDMSLVYQAQAYLIEGNPAKAIELIKKSRFSRGNAISDLVRKCRGTYMSFKLSSVIANSILLKSYLLKCDFEEAINTYLKLLKFIYSIDSDGEWLCDMPGKYLSEAISEYAVMMCMVGDAEILRDIAQQIGVLSKGFYMYGHRIGTSYSYNISLFKAIFALRTGDLDNIDTFTSNLVYCATKTYGEGNYKSGRAMLLRAVSTYLRTGIRYEIDGADFKIIDSPDAKFTLQVPCQRKFPEGCSDEDVTEFISAENAFYDCMLDIMNNEESDMRKQILSIYRQRKSQSDANKGL